MTDWAEVQEENLLQLYPEHALCLPILACRESLIQRKCFSGAGTWACYFRLPTQSFSCANELQSLRSNSHLVLHFRRHVWESKLRFDLLLTLGSLSFFLDGEDGWGLYGSQWKWLIFPFPSLGMPHLRRQKHPSLGGMCRRHVCLLLSTLFENDFEGKGEVTVFPLLSLFALTGFSFSFL